MKRYTVYVIVDDEGLGHHFGATSMPLKDRWAAYKSKYRRKVLPNVDLVAAFDAVGIDRFHLEELAAFPTRAEAHDFEDALIREYEHGGITNLRGGGWNGPMLPRGAERIAKAAQRPEVRAKISATLTGRTLTDEHRENISLGFTPEGRAALGAMASRLHKGKPKSPEHRAKIGDAQRGKKRGPYKKKGAHSAT